MGKAIRTIFIGFVSLFVLLAAGLTIFAYTFDFNKYKPMVVDAVKKQTGRDLLINGDIGLSIWPVFGVSIGQVQLKNTPEFDVENFAKINEANVGIAVWPLLSKEIEVTGVNLDGAHITLIKNKDGTDNWSDLMASQSEPAPTNQPESDQGKNQGGIPTVTIGGVSVTNSVFEYQNAQDGQSVKINNLNLNTGAVALNQNIDVSLSFDFESAAPAMKVHYETSLSVLPDLEMMKFQLDDVTTKVSVQSKELQINNLDLTLNTVVTAALLEQKFDLPALKLVATIDTPALPEPAKLVVNTGVSADLGAQTVSVPKIAITFNDLNINASASVSSLLQDPVVEFSSNLNTDSLRDVLASLGVELPESEDKAVLSNLSLETSGVYKSTGIKLSPVNIKLDESNLNGDINVGLSEALTTVGFNFNLDKLNADRYLPPPSEEEEPEANPEDAEKSDMFAWMDTTRLNGKFNAGELIVSKVTLKDIATGVKSDDKKITVAPIDATIWNGKQEGTLIVERGDPPKIYLTEKLQLSSIETVLNDIFGKSFLDGAGTINLNANMAGLSVESILRSINADGKIALSNGSIPRINLSQEVREAKAKLLGKTYNNDSPKRSAFSDFISQFTIENGVLKMSDLSFEEGAYVAKGNWNVDIATQGLNAELDFVIPESAKDKVDSSLRDFAGIPIPITLSGSITSPRVKVDLDRIWKKLQDELKDKAKAKLKAEQDKLKADLKDKRDDVKADLKEKADAEADRAKEKLDAAADKNKDKIDEKADELKNKAKEKLKEIKFDNPFK